MTDFGVTSGGKIGEMTTTQLTKFIQEILNRETSKQYIVLEADQVQVNENGLMVIAKGASITDANYYVHVFGATGEPPLTNSWVTVASQPARYYKDIFGVVHLMGAVQNGTVTQTMMTLNPGYRPPFQMIMPVRAGGSTVGTIIINTDGTIKHETGTNTLICLDNIHYKAA